MDFIDLDEEDFIYSENTTNRPTKHFSPNLPTTTTTTIAIMPQAIFLRSTSPISSHSLEQEELEDKPASTEFFNIKLCFQDKAAILRFNPQGPSLEGRDSQVFRGSLHPQNTSDSSDFSVAIKVYKDEEEAIAGAKKEVEIVRELGKENCGRFLKLFHSGTLKLAQRESFVTIWEWIEGGSLDRFIAKSKVICYDRIILEITKSMAILHSKRIAHHDLKPQNILIDRDRIILVDFGDSIRLNDSADCLVPLDEGIGKGTLAYTAPELLSRKSDFYDPLAADVYSYGVLLFYLLNQGRIMPFNSLIPHRAVQLILAVQKGFFAGGYNPESPRDSPLYELMIKCLQVDPLKRPKFPEILETVTMKLELE